MGERADPNPGARVPAESHGYWRSFEEWAGRNTETDAADPLATGSVHASDPGFDRRDFLRLLGASIALAGVGGCLEPPREPILPYTVRPPEVTPGLASFYATTMTLDGFGTGLLVESREGRPTKIEGNPDHPASLGAAGIFEQASVLQLYDPDRVKGIRYRGRPATWQDFARAFGPRPAGTADRGEGLRILLEPTASPLTAELVSRVRDAFPTVGAYFHSPLRTPSAVEGARLAFGRALQPVYVPVAAAVILALDADFLASGPFHLRYAREFADRRREPAAGMNRLYVAEGALSVTGGAADHRLRVRPGEIEAVLEAVFADVVASGEEFGAVIPEPVKGLLARQEGNGNLAAWIRAAARDLMAHPGAGLVIVGDRQPPRVHALAHLLNAVLGNVGRTLGFIESPLIDAGGPGNALETLADEIRAGAVTRLLILGVNPAYTASADLDFASLIQNLDETAYLGLHDDETARCCAWVIPRLHYLESWGDARALDGTASLVQPLIAP
ncbi:MAG TPA: hypothetical protein VNZ57_12385, partial [Longimicrobiales bacterium]|nr:hypothetical protein [Longimicrobiales bacterium]